MRKSGTHDTVTMDITGHSTKEMFDRYNTVNEQEKIEAVKKMESYLLVCEQKQATKGNPIWGNVTQMVTQNKNSQFDVSSNRLFL